MEKESDNRFSYRKEGNEYVLYDGDTVLCNPDDEIVSTGNEELAVKLVEALNNREAYTSGESLLCYHFTYCNLRSHTLEEFVAEFSSYMDYDTFLYDNYLMLGQGAPVKQTIAPALAGTYKEMLKSFNKYQFTAILVVHQMFDSWVLSLRFIRDIVQKMEEESYDKLKEDFLEEFDEYYRCMDCEAGYEDDVFDEKEHAERLGILSRTIDAFVYYFTLK